MSHSNPTASHRERVDHFEGCVRPLLPALRGAALRLTRKREDADDLLQETVMRAWRFWDHYEPDSNLRAWLHRILRNAFVNCYRRTRRERDVMAQARVIAEQRTGAASEPAAMHAALSDEVLQPLDALAPEFRAVLWAVAVDELSYRETADNLGCPVGTVMSRLHRARRGMSVALQPYAHAHGFARSA
jgi:RNA polymerase sigma-70 factor (ECF subfamily)